MRFLKNREISRFLMYKQKLIKMLITMTISTLEINGKKGIDSLLNVYYY